MPIRNQVQLITYPDSLGGDLKTLNAILSRHFAGLFGGIHILPPFPSSGDRGFAPQTYFEIEPRFGRWEDVSRIGKQADVVVDLMVNHISRQSVYFKDFQQKGRRSEYADLFITLDKVWPDGNPAPGDVAKIFLRRPEHPFADIRIEETGEIERIWATFGTRDWSEQMDVDINAPVTRALFQRILQHMSQQGVKMVRLDAVAYVTKKPGTSCFFIEPEIYEFMDWIGDQARAVGIELLPEIHAEYEVHQKLADHGYWDYNFILPLGILHTLLSQDSRMLREHLSVCPRKQFTTLDCHDGIPVQPDVNGIISIDEAQAVVQTCLDRGANLSVVHNLDHRLRPDYDAHQINITYYSALGSDDAYLTARAIQFFAPGIPQVYYVGLLAGENDTEELQRSGERRSINRHNYTVEEVDRAVEKPVVQRLIRLIRFRNEYPAFQGAFQVLDSDDHHLSLAWTHGDRHCRLDVDLERGQSTVEYQDEAGGTQRFSP